MARRIKETMAPKIEEVIARQNKRFGNDTLVNGDDVNHKSLPRCTTGSLAFDVMLGGGWPLNQWNEIIGNESNGKTVMVLKTIAANQALDPDYHCLWVASEEFVPDWAATLGVDLKRVTLATTNVMEEAYQIVIDMLDARVVDAVVIDSLPALVPGEEDEKTMEQFAVGLGARLTGKFMRKSSKAQRRSLVDEERNCLGLIINQWREKIGVIYGDPRTTPGGKAKNFHYFTRVEVARDEWLEVDKKKVGLAIKARTIKNKTAPPQRQGVVDFYFDDYGPFHKGDYDSIKETFSLAVANDIVIRRGAYYEYKGQRWQGKEPVLASLREEVDLATAMSAEVLEALTRGL
jgi:recombination protein RecA